MAFVESLLIGYGIGFSLAAPPGPVLTQLAYETARGRPWKGFSVGLGAMTADATFFVLVFFGFLHVLPDTRFLAVLALGGCLLMLYFARLAWQSARRPFEVTEGSRLTGFPGGYLLAALSPFNIGWWISAGAPALDRYGASLALGFFLAILSVIVASVLIVRFAAAKIQRFETYVSYASALFLVAFAALLGYHSWVELT